MYRAYIVFVAVQHQSVGSGYLQKFDFLFLCFFSITKKGSKVVCFALKIFLAWVLVFFAVSYMMGGVKNICLQPKDPLQSVCQAWEFSWG